MQNLETSLNTVDSTLPEFGQENGISIDNNHLFSEIKSNSSASFAEPMTEEINDIEVHPVNFDSDLEQTVFKNAIDSYSVSQITAEFGEENSELLDPLTGEVPLVNWQAVLEFAVDTAQDRLKLFTQDEQFLDKMELAFGDDWSTLEAESLIKDLANGEVMPEIKIVSATELKNADGAFGAGTIYISEEFLSKNVTNSEAVKDLVLEELGHYVDEELSESDSRGDEGNIFAELVDNEQISEAELGELKVEDDHTTIVLDGEEISVELATPSYPGYLFVYESGEALSYDSNVETWQQQMKDRGWDIDVDGLYGSQSASIARQFQEAKDGLDVDGIVGPNTWEATFDTSTPPFAGELFIYESGETLSYDFNVETWQQQMKDQGWNIDVDGLYGPQSASIARQFQEEKGLTVDGIVGSQTWEATFDTDNVTPPSDDPPSEEPPDESNNNFGENIAAIAREEWEFFDRGNLKETEDGAWQRVVEYWETQGINDSFGVDTSEEVGSSNNPWSAVFISWVMDRANVGDKFEYSASHSTYITDAIQDRANNNSEAAFFGYRLDEYSPKVGDLVGYAREDGVDYDTPAPYASHTDIVVDVRDGEIDVIGGNVADSVTKKTLEIDSEGRLIDDSEDWFVILSNQLNESGSSSNDDNSASDDSLIGTADPLYPDYSEREEVTPDPNYSDYSGQITVNSDLDANMRAFLDTISYAEGTYSPDGYRTIFGGDTFEDFTDHPRERVPFGDTYSTAAGRYQFLEDTWDGVSSTLDLANFNPENQDLAAVKLIENRGADDEVEAGEFEEAIEAVNREWASLPGSPYGQPTKSLEELQGVYEASLQKYENT